MGRTVRVLLAATVLMGLIGASCGADDVGSRGTEVPSSVSGDVTVFAAASLTDAFTEIGDAFAAADPGATVTFNFAGSSSLATQINEGASADVFASADPENMTKVTDESGSASEPVVFTTNVAEIVVEAGNPEGITGVADLENEDLIVVQCAPEVPCGSYAAQIFARAGVTVTPRSFEENVKGVVTKVSLGEADAGIVYRTDVVAAGSDAEGVEIPAEINVVADYPIALVEGAANAGGAMAFIDFVNGEQGQEILASYGFVAP
jgi:molybdate transport system substrate-binding protein